jgi:methanogenic corrinoid protein MtbC1
MSQQNEFVATVLQRGGSAFAGFAAADMLETRPEAGAGLGADPLALWKQWLTSRVEELAVAVSAGKPQIFAEQVRWAASLFKARSVPTENIKASLESLGRVLAHDLPENAQTLVNEYLATAVTALETIAADEPAEITADTDDGRLAASFLLALLEGDRQKAISTVHDAAANGWKLSDLYLRVLAPAQREVGRMWLNDEINVAEEHFATATTKMVMSQLAGQAEAQPHNGKTVVAAAVPDNQHDLGLQMVADVFELNGWRTISLGANVPVSDLVQATESFQADLLLISAALGKHLTNVRDTIRAIRQHDATRHIKILVGGTAFAGLADLAEEYGADGYAANAAEALELANRMVGLVSSS